MMFIAKLLKMQEEKQYSFIIILFGGLVGFAIIALMTLVGMWLYNTIFPIFGAPVINFNIALATVFLLNEIRLFIQNTKQKRA